MVLLKIISHVQATLSRTSCKAINHAHYPISTFQGAEVQWQWRLRGTVNMCPRYKKQQYKFSYTDVVGRCVQNSCRAVQCLNKSDHCQSSLIRLGVLYSHSEPQLCTGLGGYPYQFKVLHLRANLCLFTADCRFLPHWLTALGSLSI